PREQAAPLADALRLTGAEPIIYPTIQLEPPPSWTPLDRALGGSDAPYAWAIFTSPSAVRLTCARAAETGALDRLKALRVAAVGVVPVSRTAALSDLPELPAFNAVVFASPSALRAFVDRWGTEALVPVVVAVIGPTTAAAAREMSVRVDVMPSVPSMSALV